MPDQIDVTNTNFELVSHRVPQSGCWETGIPGLKRRHVKSIRVEWEDRPPSDIAEARLRDIMQALRFGFKKTDRILDAHEERLSESLSGSQED